MTMKKIHILLVEDQTLMRQGLKTILSLEPGLDVVGEAAD
jgi:DNA-binding NarL/FixJ family response regulator